MSTEDLLPEDFADLLVELTEAGVEFVVVGGWAVVLHGLVRATDDLDVFVRPNDANSRRVFDALTAFGAPLSAHGVTPDHFAVEGDAYRFGVAPLKVEVLSQISGVTFDEASAESQYFEVGGCRIPYIGRSALIRNKRAAGRHKDLADVEALEGQ
ncbi:MAG: hypothetical protein H6718_08485 [Polyangiaceae bacterium]|nr:hypothetical protein [Myxococcales bacterium]MCB9585422.1 hypothetical protein [Polyangiaceae bacterium]MCB9606562.1 hypothetical protein [Polyangiaceae bacterium]